MIQLKKKKKLKLLGAWAHQGWKTARTVTTVLSFQQAVAMAKKHNLTISNVKPFDLKLLRKNLKFLTKILKAPKICLELSDFFLVLWFLKWMFQVATEKSVDVCAFATWPNVFVIRTKESESTNKDLFKHFVYKRYI